MATGSGMAPEYRLKRFVEPRNSFPSGKHAAESAHENDPGAAGDETDVRVVADGSAVPDAAEQPGPGGGGGPAAAGHQNALLP